MIVLRASTFVARRLSFPGRNLLDYAIPRLSSGIGRAQTRIDDNRITDATTQYFDTSTRGHRRFGAVKQNCLTVNNDAHKRSFLNCIHYMYICLCRFFDIRNPF